MLNKKFNFLETYKRVVIVPFDSTGIPIVFGFQHDVPNATQINIGSHFLFATISISLYLGSSIYFFFFEATSFVQHSDTFYPIITLIVGLCSCILQIIVRPKMIEMIDNFEMVINERKFNLHAIHES